MKNIRKKFLWFGLLGAIIGAFSLRAAEAEAVSMKAHKSGKVIEIEFNIKKGYGIQKKGPHELAVFSLKKNFSAKENLGKSFETGGKLVIEIKPVKFTGNTSHEDEDYFSNVNTVTAPVSVDGKTGIRARVFYCSFKDFFCSVQNLNAVIE